MNTLETLEKLLETTPEDVFEERYGRRPANDWWDTRALAGAASALRNRRGTAARKALPGLLSATRTLEALRGRCDIYTVDVVTEEPASYRAMLDVEEIQAVDAVLGPLLREAEE